MPSRVLVTHAVLHCDAHTPNHNGRSDKIWAGVVVATPGQPAQTYTLYGRRGATLTQSTKAFATTPDALRYFDQKMTEKLERHLYHRCDWRDSHYGVRYDLVTFFPELLALRAFDAPRPRTTSVAYAALPRPATPVAYPAGIYEVDQESAWWYVVPDDVAYGYATSPNAMLIERGYAGYPPRDAKLLPTWVWRASKKSAALLAPKAQPWHRADAAKLIQTAGLELIAAVLGGRGVSASARAKATGLSALILGPAPTPLAETRLGQLMAEGRPTVTVYYVMPSGRVRSCEAAEDPDPTRPGWYFTERHPDYSYPLGRWTGQLTPGEAVGDMIGHTTGDLERARKRVERLERSLARYEAAQEKLTAGG